MSVLAQIERQDEVTAPLVRLHLAALGGAGDAWDAGVPSLDPSRLADGLPLLHRETLVVSGTRAAELLDVLTRALPDRAESADDRRAIATAAARGALDPLALLQASVCQDTPRLADLAEDASVSLEPLLVVGQFLAQPLLRACGRTAAPLLAQRTWDAGYCPVCAAWPALAERRGLERWRFLRCARCTAEWRYPSQRCPYCGNRDPKTLGYLAPEAQREARQAATCDVCQTYVKSVATPGALGREEIVAADLTTLELDVAAIEHGYARPDERAFPLEVSVIDGGG